MFAYGLVDGFSTGGGPTDILGLVAGETAVDGGGGGDGGSSFLMSEEMSKPRNGFDSLVVRGRIEDGGGDVRDDRDEGRPNRWKGGLILWRPNSENKRQTFQTLNSDGTGKSRSVYPG